MESPRLDFDVLVLGGGPAGMVSAITASESGLKVGLIDEQAEAGGQIWRAPWAATSQGHACSGGGSGRSQTVIGLMCWVLTALKPVTLRI